MIQIIDITPDPISGLERKIYVFSKNLNDAEDRIDVVTKRVYYKNGEMLPTKQYPTLDITLPVTNDDFVDITTGKLIPDYHTEENSNPDTKKANASPQLDFLKSLTPNNLKALGFQITDDTPIYDLIDDLVVPNVLDAVERGIYD